MTVLAFLQNQWFKNTEKIAEIYARHADSPENRAKLNARFLFYRSLTGRRLMDAFGQGVCDRIIWEEASREVGGVSSHCPPADPVHIKAAIEHFKPDLVLTFGKVAKAGVLEANQICDGVAFKLIHGPHPAARHPTAAKELQAMASEVRRLVYASLVDAK